MGHSFGVYLSFDTRLSSFDVCAQFVLVLEALEFKFR